MNLSHMQKTQPWSIPYAARVLRHDDERTMRLANHTILHAAKSVGKLAAVIESSDHREEIDLTQEELRIVRAMSADLVTTALRLANLFGFDLEADCLERVAAKNGEAYPPEDTSRG
jgi:hypothetical protein